MRINERDSVYGIIYTHTHTHTSGNICNLMRWSSTDSNNTHTHIQLLQSGLPVLPSDSRALFNGILNSRAAFTPVVYLFGMLRTARTKPTRWATARRTHTQGACAPVRDRRAPGPPPCAVRSRFAFIWASTRYGVFRRVLCVCMLLLMMMIVH